MVSVAGYVYLTDFLDARFGIHDTGMPRLASSLSEMVLTVVSTL